MKVMNYYKLTEEELDFKINQIREWLFDNQKDDRHQTACFALEVALCSKELRQEGTDDFVKVVIDYLC